MLDFVAALLLIAIFGSIFLAFFFAPLLELTLWVMKGAFYLILGAFYLVLWVLKFIIFFLIGPIALIGHTLIKYIRHSLSNQPQQ